MRRGSWAGSAQADYGTGRKPATCEALRVDLFYLARHGMLIPGRVSQLNWTCRQLPSTGIHILALDDRVVLLFRARIANQKWETRTQSIAFVTVATNFSTPTLSMSIVQQSVSRPIRRPDALHVPQVPGAGVHFAISILLATRVGSAESPAEKGKCARRYRRSPLKPPRMRSRVPEVTGARSGHWVSGTRESCRPSDESSVASAQRIDASLKREEPHD